MSVSAGLQLSQPRPTPEDTSRPKEKHFKNPDTWKESMKYGMLVSGNKSITQKGKQKGNFKDRFPQIPKCDNQGGSRLLRETH